ncbi:MAG: hypothetical protein DRI44_05505 [Chlamydiae bacterium]|nr:MAG: hypothetical protein DRI44_05505 [Chlamydiota bacterium]
MKKFLISVYTYISFAFLSLYSASWGIQNFFLHRPNKFWREPGNNFYLSKEFFIIALLIVFSLLALSNLIYYFINKKLLKNLFFALLFYGFLCNIIWVLIYAESKNDILNELTSFITTTVIWTVAMGSVFFINKKGE